MTRLTTIALAALAAAPLAQERNLAEAFPATTIFYGAVDDIDQLEENLKRMDVGQLFTDLSQTDPELIDAILSPLHEALDDFEAKTSIDAVEMLSMLKGSAGFGLMGPLDPDEKLIAIGFLVELGESTDEFAEKWDELWNTRVESADVSITYEELDGLDVTLVEASEGSLFSYAFAGDVMIATLESESARKSDYFLQLLDSFEGKTEALAETDLFAASTANAEGASLSVFLDTATVLDALRTDDGWRDDPTGNVALVMDTLGVADIGSLATSVRWEDDTVVGMTTLGWGPGGRIHDIVSAALLEGPPAFAEVVPDTALLYTSGHFDLYEFTNNVLRALIDFELMTPAELADGLQQVNQSAGIDPIEDIVATFDGRFAFMIDNVDEMWAIPETAGTFVGPLSFGFLIGLEDADTMRSSLSTALRNSGVSPSLVTEDFQGTEITSLKLAGVPFQLTWTITNDMFAVALAPEIVQNVLRRRTTPDLPSIATLDDVIAALERIGNTHSTFTRTSPEYSGASIFANIELMEQLLQRPLPLRDLDIEALVDKHFDHSTIGGLRFIDDTFVIQQIGG